MSFQPGDHSPVWRGGWCLSMAAARPSKEFDLVEVEKLGMLGPPRRRWRLGILDLTRNFSGIVGLSGGVPGVEFRRACDKGFGRLKISLCRQQVESAMGGNVTMLIWLGKQLLDQADKRELIQEATITEKTGPLALSPEDDEFRLLIVEVSRV